MLKHCFKFLFRNSILISIRIKMFAVEIRIQKEIYSVEECMRRVTYALRRAQGTMAVDAIFRTCRSRVELVVTFLAVLELLKIGQCATVAEGEDGNTIALRYTPN